MVTRDYVTRDCNASIRQPADIKQSAGLSQCNHIGGLAEYRLSQVHFQKTGWFHFSRFFLNENVDKNINAA